MDDWRLLRQYVEEGSQAAFSRLVDRHIDMVYWACRRDVDSNQAAEDATQDVFMSLARKAASLPHSVPIAGWLFGAARYAAQNVKRSEARRRRYEQEAAKHMERIAMHQAVAQEAGWQQVEPWLNDGLSRLPALDRNVLLLRYFEGASVAEVALATGVSEPAARKRISRAVDRLRQYLLKKDVAVSSLALPALLSQHAASAVSDAFRAAVLQSLRRVSPVSSAHPINLLVAKGLLIMSTTKISAGSVAAVAVLLILSFAIMRHAHPAPVTWKAGQPSDATTEQAVQQMQTGLNQFTSAALSGDVQKMEAVTAPGSRAHAFARNKHAKPPFTTYSMTITSCIIKGNMATAMYDEKYTLPVIPGFNSVPGQAEDFPKQRCSFVNTGGKWLLSR